MENSEIIYYYQKGCSKLVIRKKKRKNFFNEMTIKKAHERQKDFWKLLETFHQRKQAFQVMSHVTHFPGILNLY